MYELILSNAGLWINFIIPVIAILFLYFSHNDVTIEEVSLQIFLSFFLVFGLFTLAFYNTTDIIDVEQLNGRVTSAEYLERYEYEYDCSYDICDDDGGCVTISQTCEDIKPAEYYLTTTVGRVDIQDYQYRRFSGEFGEFETDLKHYDQTYKSKNLGEGDQWTSIVSKLMPVSVNNTYENLVLASKTNIVNTRETESEIRRLKTDNLLEEYPKKYRNDYGITLQHRIIDNAKVFSSHNEWLLALDKLNANLGSLKQCNVIIYTTTEPMSFVNSLKSYWNNAKKNDIIIVFGIEDKKLVWSDVITWTDESSFVVEAQDTKNWKIDDLNFTMSNLHNLIAKEYKRKSMKDYEYLKENITIDFKYQVYIFLINLFASIGSIYFFIKNNLSKHRYSKYRN